MRLRQTRPNSSTRRRGEQAASTGGRVYPNAAPTTEALSADGVLDLQQKSGNQAVSGLLQSGYSVQRQVDEKTKDQLFYDDKFTLGRKLLMKGDFDGAEKIFKELYAEAPDVTQASGYALNLGLCRQAKGDFQGALSFYEEGINTIGPNRNNDFTSEVMERMKEARLRKPPKDFSSATRDESKVDAADHQLANDKMRLGKKLMKKGDIAGAEKLFKELYADTRFSVMEYPGVGYNLGMCRHMGGDFREAISYYEESLNSPNNTEQRKREVMEMIRRARLRKPLKDPYSNRHPEKKGEDTSGPHPTLRKGDAGLEVSVASMKLTNVGIYTAGVTDEFGDKMMGAVKEFQKSRKLEPDGIIGPLTWVALDKETGTETPDASELQLADDKFVLARKLLAKKQYREAEKLFKELYADPKLAPADNVGFILNLGYCRHAQGDFSEAVSMYDEALNTPGISEDYRTAVIEAIRRARLRKPPA